MWPGGRGSLPNWDAKTYATKHIKGKSSFKGVLPKPDSKSFSDVAVLAFPIHKGFYETNQTRNPKLSTNLAGLPLNPCLAKAGN